jgi:hypothetical protein
MLRLLQQKMAKDSKNIIVREQIISLIPTDNIGRWMGHMVIDGTEFRVEAYAAEGGDEVTLGLIDELYVLADVGGPLRRHPLPDGTEVYLTVLPKGA